MLRAYVEPFGFRIVEGHETLQNFPTLSILLPASVGLISREPGGCWRRLS